VKKRKNPTKEALEKRLGKAQDLSNRILEKIQEHPHGLTKYDLAKYLLVTPLGIQKAVDRIKNLDEKIIVKERKRKKQIAKFYFPRESTTKKNPPNYFEIKIVDSKLKWKEHAMFFLDMRKNQILIYPKSKSTVDKNLFSETIPVHYRNNVLTFIIPEKISYGLETQNKEPIIKIEKDHIIMSFQDREFTLPEIPRSKVLILDDQDIITIKNIKDHLSERHSVDYFKDQNTVLKKLKTKKYDFLILDWILDNVPLRHKEIMQVFLKTNPKGKAVIITSRTYDRDTVIKFTPKGITWFFDKSIDRLAEKIEDEMRGVLS